MILPRQKKEAPLSLNNPSVSSYTLASFQTQLLLFYNSQYPFMPKLENWALKICIGLYSLFSSSLKPLKSDVFSLLLWCSVQSLSRVQLFVIPWTVWLSDYGIFKARIQEWVALQGIFPTQGLNLGLPCCGWILYHLSCQGNWAKLQKLEKWQSYRTLFKTVVPLYVLSRNVTLYPLKRHVTQSQHLY